MAEEPDHLALQQRGAAAISGPLDDLAGRFVNCKEIGAVNGDAWKSEACSPVHITVGRDRPFDRRRFRVTVVLNHKNNRQVPDGRQVQAFQEHALV